jgi:peptidoglycan/xylan/chitin deacetylase (PgdA/CDA1 family)
MANQLMTSLANSRAASVLITLLEKLNIRSSQTLRILTYHRVIDAQQSPHIYPRITVHPDVFEQHMRYLSQHCNVVNMEQVLSVMRTLHPSRRVHPTRVNPGPRSLSSRPYLQSSSQADSVQAMPGDFEPGSTSEPRILGQMGEVNTPRQPADRPAGRIPNTGAKRTDQLPSRPVLITFDDAYTDFSDHALPVLQRYNLPATLFVPTAFPGSPQRPFWWDQLYRAVEQAYNLDVIMTPLGNLSVSTPAQRRNTFSLLRDHVKSLPHSAALEWVDNFCAELEVPRLHGSVLSWDALREMSAAGITLGPHTRNHPMLDRIREDEVRAEAVGSWQDLRREIGETLPIFAYPSGGYTRRVLNILKQEGFELGFTTQRGVNALSKADPLQLKRINVGPNTSLNLLRAQMVL